MKESNKKKGGRPSLEASQLEVSKPSKRATINFSNRDFEIHRKNAKTANLKFSAYVREITKNGTVTNLFSEVEQKAKNDLIGMSNNLNQLVKEAHTYGLLAVEKDALILLHRLRLILDRYDNPNKHKLKNR
jgi:Bacterial mobilisation protein (MobC)